MVVLPGVGHQSYVERFWSGQPRPVVPCPDPACLGASMAPHASYKRYVDGVLMKILRLACPRCEVTHAVLPEDVCAYRDATLNDLETALDEGAPTAAARAAGQTGEAGTRRTRRWLRMLTDALFVQQILAVLPPVEGSWLERARLLLGPAPGVLVRLRHYLVTQWQLLLGPPWLFRHGRPRWAIRRPTTHLGNCLSEGRSCRPH